MNQREFQEEVCERAAQQGVPERSAEAAIELLNDTESPSFYGHQHVRKCLMFAKRLAAHAEASARKNDEPTRREILTDLPPFNGKKRSWHPGLVAGIRALRCSLFGSEDPPFLIADEGDKRAAAWIRNQNPTSPGHLIAQGSAIHRGRLAGMPRYQALYQQVIEDVQLLSEISGFTHTLSMDQRRLSFFNPEEGGEWRVVTYHTRSDWAMLYTLAGESQTLSLVTGVPQEEMVRFILCGVRPLLPVATIEQHTVVGGLQEGFVSGHLSGVATNQVVIRAFTPLTFEELRQWHTRSLRLWESDLEWHSDPDPVSRRISARDQQLMDVVASLGGVPERTPRTFWEEALKELQHRGYEDGRLKAGTVRKRWERLQRKLPGRPGS